MTRLLPISLVAVMLALALGAAGAGWSAAPLPEPNPAAPRDALGTAFTYQGQLRSNGHSVTDTCDMEFRLFADAGGTSQVGSLVSLPVPVDDGLFTAVLDFGGTAFNGGARWLGIQVQCPDDASMVDLGLQPFTATPYALSVPWSGLSGVPAEIVAGSYSVESFGPVIDDSGRWVGGEVDIGTVANDGVRVSVAGIDGVHINRTGNASGVHSSNLNDGFEVGGAEGNGLFVGKAGASGVRVYQSVSDGVCVDRAGTPVDTSSSAHSNGFEVAGAQGYGVYVGDAGIDGLFAGTCRDDGVHIAYAMDQGFVVISSGDDGFNVRDAGSPSQYVADPGVNGVEIGGAKKNGVYIGQSDDDGIFINRVGEAVGSHPYEVQINGIEIAGVQRNGIGVGSADHNGIFIGNAGHDGLFVSTAVEDGLYVGSAGDNGVEATGDVYGGIFETTNPSGNYGVYTYDNLYSANLHTKGASMQVVQNAGTDPLESGDVVAFAGVAIDEADGTPIALVKRATMNSGPAIAGVVFSRYQCDTWVEEKTSVAPDESDGTGERARSLPGPAQPGDALLLVTHGLTQVNASAMDQAIDVGDQLAWDIASGRVTPVKDMNSHTTTGLTRAFATALEPLTSGEDQIYVFVSRY